MSQDASQLDTDRQLALQVANGDERAFDAFFKEYFPRLFRFTLTRVDNDVALAEEIVQRTMCSVVTKMKSYRGEALLFTWLCQICRNETSSYFRQHGVVQRVDLPIGDHPAVQAALESLLADDFQPESAQRAGEIVSFVRTTLEYLPANYATALEMKYIRGESVAEIAKTLGIGEKAAESVLSRARSAFKDGFRALWDVEPGFIVE